MFPKPITLRGTRVDCEPLALGHARSLFEITPPETFRYFLRWPKGLRWLGDTHGDYTLSAFEEWLVAHIENPKTRAFLVRNRATGAPVGSTAYLDLDPVNRALEVGCTWYSPAARGTHVNPQTKLLMLRTAFDESAAGCRVERVTLKCDSRNVHSQRAIEKLGAVREGILRRHRVQQDGYVRDTVMYSVTRDEWPAVRAGLEARLGGGEA